MQDVAILHEAIRRDPGDKLAWLALADWLEESGRAAQAEVLRLWRGMHALPWEDEGRQLLQRRLQARLRGGSWSSYGWGCRIAYRNCIGPSAGNNNFGLRPVLELRPGR